MGVRPTAKPAKSRQKLNKYGQPTNFGTYKDGAVPYMGPKPLNNFTKSNNKGTTTNNTDQTARRKRWATDIVRGKMK